MCGWLFLLQNVGVVNLSVTHDYLVPSLSFNNLIFFTFIRFPAILLVKTIDSYLHEFCSRGILHSDFQ